MRAIGSEDNLPELKQQLEELEASKRKEKSRKDKLLEKIEDLDPDESSYDETYDDLQGVLQKHNKKLQEIDKKITLVSGQIMNAENNAVSAEDMQKFYAMAVDHFDILDDETKQMVMRTFLDRVEIYPEKQPGGLWVKSIRFKVPIALDGQLATELEFNYTDKFLPKENSDETVVLMSRVKD